MKVIPLNELVKQNFNPVFVNSLKQLWKTTKSFHCEGDPKKHNLLLFLDGCSITYTDKTGKVFRAESGDVVYTPVGSEYRALLSDFITEDSHTLGINFFLLDETGDGLLFSREILVFHPDSDLVGDLFRQTLHHSDEGASLLRQRATLLSIFAALADNTAKEYPSPIDKAMAYLSRHVEQNPSIPTLAALCHMSEVNFRRLFKKRTGVSPAVYRTALRLQRAASYLSYGDVSVLEITDALGYATVSHFIKEFKQKYGLPPLQYRKKTREGKP